MPSNDVHSEELRASIVKMLDDAPYITWDEPDYEYTAELIVQLIETEKANAVREARIDELERICELSKKSYKNYLGDWPLFKKRIARLTALKQKETQ